jgi:hypothetical protein
MTATNDNVYIMVIQPWDSWTDADKCKVCLKGYFSTTYEVTYQDGDSFDKSKENHYVSEMCHSCLTKLVKREKMYSAQSQKVYYKLGLVTEQMEDPATKKNETDKPADLVKTDDLVKTVDKQDNIKDANKKRKNEAIDDTKDTDKDSADTDGTKKKQKLCTCPVCLRYGLEIYMN